MAKPNYDFEKRQKELAKKRKKEEKLKKKAATSGANQTPDGDAPDTPAEPTTDESNA